MKNILIFCFLICLADIAAGQTFISDPRPPKYSLKRAILPASLAFVAGASWGFHETSTNWPDRIPNNWDQQFWDGRISWENKYAKDESGNLIQPLRPRFRGATTYLAWTTDSKHLFALTHRWPMMASGIVIGARGKRPWWHYGLDVVISGAAYSAGFFITTEAFRLTSKN